MNEDFSQRLLERIEDEHIKPISRWAIFARRGLAWTVIGLSIICTSLLASLLFLAVLQVDIPFLRRSSLGPMLRLILDYVPLIWVILFLVLCALEVILLRHETRAYRYSQITVAGLVLLGVSLIGLGLYAAKLPEHFERSLESGLPTGMHPWTIRRAPPGRPEQGVLFGEVLTVSSTTVSIRGPRGEEWRVNLSKDASKKTDLLRPEQLILIEGRVLERGHFEGQDIHPFRGPRRPPIHGEKRGMQTF